MPLAPRPTPRAPPILALPLLAPRPAPHPSSPCHSLPRHSLPRHSLPRHSLPRHSLPKSLRRQLRDHLQTWSIWLGPGGLAALVAMVLWGMHAWAPLERSVYNGLFILRHQLVPRSWDSRVAVIAIDETSLQHLGQFPLPRQIYAQLLEQIAPQAPAVVAFDILMSEPSPGDEALKTAIALSGNTVILARGYDPSGKPLPISPRLLSPDPNSSPINVGHIASRPDADGVIRWIDRGSRGSSGDLSLAMVSVLAYQQVLDQTLSNEAAIQALRHRAAQIQLPPPSQAQLWVNWPEPTRSVAALNYSLVDVLAGRLPPQALANRIVLVGQTATGVDGLRTPFEQAPPSAGVYLHAALIDNLLNQRLLRVWPDHWTPLLLVMVGLGTGWVTLHRGLQGLLLTIMAIGLGWFGLALVSFSVANLWLPVAAPLGTMLLTAMVLELREKYEKQVLMELFARYVSPETAHVLWQGRRSLLGQDALLAQEQMATVMFVDLRGFTGTAEALGAQALLPWLNQYLAIASEVVMEHGGVVDKYIGDAVMAVFGVPVARTTPAEIEADAIRAVAAALEIGDRIQTLNGELERSGQPLLHVGVGIHTGLVIAGTMGSRNRLNYSVIGDTVNIAARLETLNKKLKTQNPQRILVSGATWTRVQDWYLGKPLGAIQLRGRRTSTLVYVILKSRNPQRPLPSPTEPIKRS